MRLIIYILSGIFCLLPFELLAAPETSNTSSNTESLHIEWIDKSVDPTKNFFEFANGNWQKSHPIPAVYPTWNNFYIAYERNQQRIKSIIETAEHHPQKPGSIEQKIADFYFSGMDEANIDKLGIKPLEPEFEKINNIKTRDQLQHAIAHLQMIGVNALFNFSEMQDLNNSRDMIGVAAQGGLGLPDKDYYFTNDKKFREIRETYTHYITNIFVLLGDSQDKATAEAKVIMSIETNLAKASLSEIKLRDPHQAYHPMNLRQLQNVTPYFSWKEYFKDVGHPEIKHINLSTPNFFRMMNRELKNLSIEDWKIYLRWHLISEFDADLSQPFANENFKMFSAVTGTKTILPRWKRVVDSEDKVLGFAVGKLYVEKYFPNSSKVAVQEMIYNIRMALRNDFQHLSWMSYSTRYAAIKKLDMMKDRVGYPDKWIDYSGLNIDKGPFVLNKIRANVFLMQRDLNKIGKPLDESEWVMPPQAVNAYYDPALNCLNIPAGILQPPFFDPNAPAAVNYGAIGFVIGHEMTHGFDDVGAQFDGRGNLRNWWSDADYARFQMIASSIANQFSHYTIPDNIHLQGNLVLGEAIADFGGLTLAYRAFHNSSAFKQAKMIDGFTPDQQLFLSAAHVFAENIRSEELRHMVTVDPHPPSIFRINGTFADMPQFQSAYHIASRSPMVNRNRSLIW